MTEIIMAKALNSLRPIDEAGEELLQKIKFRALVKVKITRSRNLKHHAKFFALMRIVYSNQERYTNPDHLLTALKIAAGWTEAIIMPSGNQYLIPKSIAFDKMDQTEFEVFYDRALDIVIEHFLPGVGREDLANEILGFAA